MFNLQTRPHHTNNFDLLRHVAAFLVLYAHAVTLNYGHEPLNMFTKGRLELSSLGVEVFFIISGWLVTQSLLHTPTRWQFARKRLLRLWPALFVVTFLLTFVIGPLYSTLSPAVYFFNPETWRFLFRNIIFLPVFKLPGLFNGEPINSTFWTLLFEVFAYLILFMSGGKMLSRYRKMFAVAWVIIFIAKYYYQTYAWPGQLASYRYGTTHLVFLFFSATAWYLLRDGKAIVPKKLMIAALVIFLCSFALPGWPSMFNCIRDLCLVMLVTEWGRGKPVFHWPKWDISYGLYLLGWPVQTVLANTIMRSASSFSIFLTTLVVTIPIAFWLWYAVEKPSLDLKYK